MEEISVIDELKRESWNERDDEYAEKRSNVRVKKFVHLTLVKFKTIFPIILLQLIVFKRS